MPKAKQIKNFREISEFPKISEFCLKSLVCLKPNIIVCRLRMPYDSVEEGKGREGKGRE